MRLRRVPRESQFYDLFIELAAHLQDGTLVLAELSGIPVDERRAAARRMQEICDSADESAGARLDWGRGLRLEGTAHFTRVE